MAAVPLILSLFVVLLLFPYFFNDKFIKQRAFRYNFTISRHCSRPSMSQSCVQAKKIQLVNTNCSMDMQQSDREEIQTMHTGKKRIGRYSFYLNNLIGSGYSSKVYKGIRDNLKHQWYAIKVIKLKEMNVANIYLLNNQIDIMQKLDHQNIVKLIDVKYTANHCYIVTQYCEGGNLQKYAKNHESVEWGNIIYQVAKGCQYLASNNIVHRDLKPANIFLKNGQWKIGDFGFSKRIPNINSLIIENYKVGSPLFMPLETLERNMYSAKSDSFALGIIIYFLIFREFPWNGSNLAKLMKNYKDKVIDWTRFNHLPIEIAAIIKGLCNMNMKERLQLCHCNFDIFLTQKSIKEIDEKLMTIKSKVTDQVILCQFINYLIKNSMLFLQDDHILYSLMSNNIYHLTQVFKWSESKCLNQMRKEYILPEGTVKITEDNYRKILIYLQEIINLLKFRLDSSVHQVALEKLLEYLCICRFILHADVEGLSAFLKSIVLHKNYSDLLPNTARIQFLMKTVFGNQ